MKKIFLLVVLLLAVTFTVKAQQSTLSKQDAPLYAGDKNETIPYQDRQNFTVVKKGLSLRCFLSIPLGRDSNDLTVPIRDDFYTAHTGAELLYPLFCNSISINKININ